MEESQLEEKSLIVKTFGLSQLIYNLQVYGIKRNALKQWKEESLASYGLAAEMKRRKGLIVCHRLLMVKCHDSKMVKLLYSFIIEFQ